MAAQKPGLARGTRDFGPVQMSRRNYLFGIIRAVFEKFGFQPLETPAIENLSTLTGKYGDEGDQLLFKILNSGDFFGKQKGIFVSESQSLANAITDVFSKIVTDFAQKFDFEDLRDQNFLNQKIKEKCEVDIFIAPFLSYLDTVDRSKFLAFLLKEDEGIAWYICDFFKETNYRWISENDNLQTINAHVKRFRNTRVKEITLGMLDDFDSKVLVNSISEKGLRYDLTVPFARYVVMNQHLHTFPFKRYQIQPVWRADRPQKGRYREFFQCDADVVGTISLLCEAEIVLMIKEVFEKLGLADYSIKLNNRKILSGIAELMGAPGKEGPLCVAIDKLDKIGEEKVFEELKERGFGDNAAEKLKPFLQLSGSNATIIAGLEKLLAGSEVGLLGLTELKEVMAMVEGFGEEVPQLAIDPTLARGLSYYTGCIFEVKPTSVQMGSICGGGRYDDLTGMFGLPNVSGVGISFGIDRIYDVLDELNLFPAESVRTSKVLIANFDQASAMKSLAVLG
ncbi:MAG: ATP phosphoribosyltransferase regulatory subunit, partial [Imperialibacter sp.]